MANQGLQEDGLLFLPTARTGRRSVPQLSTLNLGGGGGFVVAPGSAVEEDARYIPPPQLPAAFGPQPAVWDDGAIGRQLQQGVQDDGLLLLPTARQTGRRRIPSL